MTTRKIATLFVVGFIVFFMVNSPKDAANVVKNTQHVLGQSYTSLSEFVKNL